MKRESSRRVQRIVSGRGFYNSPNLRQDCVLIGAEGSTSNSEVLSVGKVIALLRILPPNRNNITGNEDEKEFMFVQYFDVVKPVDKMDKTLGCIRLRWATSESEQEVTRIVRSSSDIPVGKWFDLLDLSSMRGSIHVVRGDCGLDGVLISKDADSIPWYNQHFYINRFFFDSTQEIYDVES